MFKVGQRVRVVKSLYGYEGKLATVVALERDGWTLSIGAYRGPQIEIDGVGLLNGAGKEMISPPGWIVPLDDDVDYKRFMERVLKPIPIEYPGQPA